ncbi:MAG: sigma-70 family RNA polymerase sigma factor [Bacteroidales bacterium]|nr:sigma-70 family RNA polymerase sigma factor [Bacteroidales bacterium]
MRTTEFQNKLIELQEKLISFAYSLTSDMDYAYDLVQDTFLKALKNSNKFKQDSNIKAWTFTILKNTFINNYRQFNRHPTYNNFTKESFYKQPAHGWDTFGPEAAYTTKELENSIETLNETLKLPLRMHHEGFTYKEIAKTLALKLGTVKSRIYFARKKIMEQLCE